MKHISSSSIFPKSLQIPSAGTSGSLIEKPTGPLWNLWCPRRLAVISSPHHRAASHIALCVPNGINKHQERGGLSIAILLPLLHPSQAAALPLSSGQGCRGFTALPHSSWTLHALALCLQHRTQPSSLSSAGQKQGTASLPQTPGSPLRNTPSSTAFWPQPYFSAFRDWQKASHVASYLHI